LVKGVLKHFRYSLTNGHELGELWDDVESMIEKPTGREYPINKKKIEVNSAIKAFNEAFGELFKPDSPEYILKHAKPILDQFNHNIQVTLRYAQETIEGFEIPCIFDNHDFFEKAAYHLQHSDYKAAAVYTRSAFEKIIRTYCKKKKKKLVFKSRLKDYSSEDFLKEVKPDLHPKTITDIEQYRNLVLNAFSHYNTEKHEIRTELLSVIQVVKALNAELKSMQS